MSERRVLVVGSTSGLGSAIISRLAGRGDAVVRADLAATDSTGRGSSHYMSVDISDERSVVECVLQATERLAGLDVVVNCAGVLGSIIPSHEVDTEEFDRIMTVNLRGAFLLSRQAIPELLKSPAGRLIHIASLAGKVGNPEMTAYSASKAGVIGLVKALGKEYAGSGLTVNAVAPAAMNTPMIQEMSPERRAKHEALIPVGRFGSPGVAAALVEYIASEEAGFTTGFTFDLSGGRADY